MLLFLTASQQIHYKQRTKQNLLVAQGHEELSH